MSIRSNKKGLSCGPAAGLTALLFCLATTVLAPELPCSFVYAQSAGRVRSIAVDFVPEGGCPVEPTNIRCELDVDPFDAPMDARVYVDYRNNSDRPVAAVKFRLRFVDAQNRDRGTFHAVDMATVSPQGSHGLKAKKDFTLHPAVVALKARVLQVKYQDGSDWTSTKMQELAQPASVPGGGGFTINGGSGAAGGNGGGGMSDEGGGEMPARSAPVQSYAPYSAAPAQAAPVQRQPAPQSSPPPWSANPKEYENPAAAVPPAGRGLSAGADVVDSFAPGSNAGQPAAMQNQVPFTPQAQAPAQAPAQAQAAPPAMVDPFNNAPAANAPANSAAAASVPPAAAASTSSSASASSSSAAAPMPATTGRYQGVQPTNVPYSPDNDK